MEVSVFKHIAVIREPLLLFSKTNNTFFGYFDPENIFLDNEKSIFRGDLTDISTKKRSTDRNSYRSTHDEAKERDKSHQQKESTV